MKPHVFLPTLILLFLSYHTSAEKKEKNVQLKAYYNFSRVVFSDEFNYNQSNSLSIRPETFSNSFGEFSVGVVLRNNPTINHEFELMPFSMNKTSHHEDIMTESSRDWEYIRDRQTTINSRLRYQLNYVFTPSQKIDFYLGFSSMLSYFRNKTGGYSSLDFAKKYQQIGVIVGLTPGVSIPLSEKLNLSFDVPIGMFGIYYKKMNHSNPALPSNERTQNKFAAELWNQGFQVRAGIGFNL